MDETLQCDGISLFISEHEVQRYFLSVFFFYRNLLRWYDVMRMDKER